jgi:isocitrate dehydrogenase (NAD+)
MLLSHIGFQEKADRLQRALEKCTIVEKRLVITGRPDGATGADFADYILEEVNKNHE